jgi:hypothetical protein
MRAGSRNERPSGMSIVMDDHLLQDAIPRSGIEEDAHERKRALI